MFAYSPGNRGSIPGRVIPKTQKMVLGSALLSTQYYKIWIKGKVELLKRELSGHPRLRSLIYLINLNQFPLTLTLTEDFEQETQTQIHLIWEGVLLFFREYPIFTNPSARAGYDTRSIFKRSLTGLNSEFSFS